MLRAAELFAPCAAGAPARNVSFPKAALLLEDVGFMVVVAIASGSRVAVVKIVPFQSVWMKRQSGAVAPKHPGVPLVSIAVTFKALLLHGETRPLTHLPARASSASFIFLSGPDVPRRMPLWQCHSTPAWPRMQKNCGGRGESQSLARPHAQPVSCRTRVSLPAMPALN